MLYRLLLPGLIIFLVIFAIFNFQNLKKDLIYKLGIANDNTISCYSVDQISQSGDFDEKETYAIFNSKKVSYPKTSLTYGFLESVTGNFDNNVLGTTNAKGEEKWIEVSLSEQKVRAWEGTTIVIEFPISSGKWAPTPTGTYHIWYKTRNQKMSGGSKEIGTYYYLPNVPHNMFFYQGYALHGTYWHNNFGSPMSHGCVNAPLNYAAQIFDWAGPVLPPGQNAVKATKNNPGTKVVVR